MQVNVLDAGTLEDALRTPDRYSDLMVGVAGFSACFVLLDRDVQEDIVRRHRG